MFNYSPPLISVNPCRDRYGAPLKQSTRLRAFAAGTLFLEKAPEANTVAKAASLGHVSRPTMYAMLQILQSQDRDLIAAVLDGRASLNGAAAQLRNRERLLKAFKAATTASDLAALGTIVGADEVFNAVCVPAL